jgi:hypothetical protein
MEERAEKEESEPILGPIQSFWIGIRSNYLCLSFSSNKHFWIKCSKNFKTNLFYAGIGSKSESTHTIGSSGQVFREIR